MVIVALDYGERRIGVAASDALGIAAHGLQNVENDGSPAVFERIAQVVRERGAERVVVGMPTQMDGKAGPAARRVGVLLAGLKPKHRDALSLRLSLGYSVAEIAEITDTPFNTVRNRLRRGRKLLAGRIERDPLLAEWIGGNKEYGR